MAMTETRAASIADEFIKDILKSQPTFWPQGGMSSEANARQIAKQIAAMRETLIEELKKQV